MRRIVILLGCLAWAVPSGCSEERRGTGPVLIDAGTGDADGGDGDAEIDGGPDAGADSGEAREVVDRFTASEISETLPLDFIVAVDNSGDMDTVFYQVQIHLSEIATQIAGEVPEYRFVLISDRGTDTANEQLCIPEPMAGPDCGDTGNFVHIDKLVGSQEAFAEILNCRQGCEKGGWGALLHHRHLLQILVVSNDESGMRFSDFAAALSSAGVERFMLHAVTGLLNSDWCVLRAGTQYLAGAAETGGTTAGVCDVAWTGLSLVLDGASTGPEYRYPLSVRPDAATIAVSVTAPGGGDPAEVGGWSYDTGTNSVVFDQGKEPAVGSRVAVRYFPSGGAP